MSQLADHLAQLTEFRDRDAMDATLVSTIRDLLRPRAVAIYRLVGEPERRRWLTRARLVAGETSVHADPLWTELDALPQVEDFPQRLTAMQQNEPVVSVGEAVITVFPLVTDRVVVGVVEIESVVRINPEHLHLVGSILRIYCNFQALLDYSERDTLTGLLNRKTYEDAFDKIRAATRPELGVEAALEEKRSVDVLSLRHFIGVIDIDHFKRVNDAHGHLIGDEVLLQLSRQMRLNFRYSDRLYRFGGEEFVVLMRCRSDTDAAAAFERLRLSVQAHAFARVGSVTVSVGFTEVRTGDTAGSAFERADKAVYRAKALGRNQVCSLADMPAAGDGHGAGGEVELF